MWLVNRLHPSEMFLQRWNHWPGHCRDPVFVALPLADGDLAAFEVQILDPQAKGFEQPQAATVQQHGDEPLVAAQVCQDPRYFIDGQDNREPFGAAGANDAFEAVERLFQHTGIDKQDRRQRLVLGGCRDMFLDGRAGQEPVDVVLSEFARVPTVVECDVSANAVDVGLFGAAAVVVNPQDFNHAVIEPGHRLVGKQAQGRSSLAGDWSHGRRPME